MAPTAGCACVKVFEVVSELVVAAHNSGGGPPEAEAEAEVEGARQRLGRQLQALLQKVATALNPPLHAVQSVLEIGVLYLVNLVPLLETRIVTLVTLLGDRDSKSVLSALGRILCSCLCAVKREMSGLGLQHYVMLCIQHWQDVLSAQQP